MAEFIRQKRVFFTSININDLCSVNYLYRMKNAHFNVCTVVPTKSDSNEIFTSTFNHLLTNESVNSYT